jgi:hypothetical protein
MPRGMSSPGVQLRGVRTERRLRPWTPVAWSER